MDCADNPILNDTHPSTCQGASSTSRKTRKISDPFRCSCSKSKPFRMQCQVPKSSHQDERTEHEIDHHQQQPVIATTKDPDRCTALN